MTNFEREFGDLRVDLYRRERDGGIFKADLVQHNFFPGEDSDTLQLDPFQLYGLIDAVATADPGEWYRRFPVQQVEAEMALRRVADYFRSRAEHNRRFEEHGVANTFDLAVTRVMEEIEALYEDQPKVTFCNWCGGGRPKEEFHPDGSVAHIPPRGPALQAVQDYHTRRRA